MEELSKTFMDDFEYPEDADDHTKEIDAFPYDEKPNILLVYEEVKGTLVDFTIESEEQPKPTSEKTKKPYRRPRPKKNKPTE